MNTLTDRAADGVAVGAISSPFWLPGLQEVSDIAALALPILGCIWLVIQVGFYLWRQIKKDMDDAS